MENFVVVQGKTCNIHTYKTFAGYQNWDEASLEHVINPNKEGVAGSVYMFEHILYIFDIRV